MEPRTFAMGDIHGAHKALVQCLERCNFNNEIDTLIQLGDVADGWSEVYECVEELLKIKNLIAIKGNHDDWTLTLMTTGIHPGLSQGGRATLDSYIRHNEHGQLYFPESHIKFFRYQEKYYKDDDFRLYIHGGFNRHIYLEDHSDPTIFWWDRDLFQAALGFQSMSKGVYDVEPKFKIKEPCSDIFIGHTATVGWSMDETKTSAGIILPGKIPCTIPMKAGPIYNLDTGAGFQGKLTIMDVKTKQYWQSDKVEDLYPDEYGRRKRST